MDTTKIFLHQIAASIRADQATILARPAIEALGAWRYDAPVRSPA